MNSKVQNTQFLFFILMKKSWSRSFYLPLAGRRSRLFLHGIGLDLKLKQKKKVPFLLLIILHRSTELYEVVISCKAIEEFYFPILPSVNPGNLHLQKILVFLLIFQVLSTVIWLILLLIVNDRIPIPMTSDRSLETDS